MGDTMPHETREIKICTTCHKKKPFSEFYKDACKLDGYDYVCKTCKNKRLKILRDTRTEKRISLKKENFYKECSNKHNNYYTYHNDFKILRDKIKITCPIHGIFEQEAYSHKNGCGCPTCGRLKSDLARSKDNDTFVSEVFKIYGDNIICKEEYIRSDVRIKFECKYHGIFFQTPDHLLCRNGCQKCGRLAGSSKQKKSKEQFILDAIAIHGAETYNYDSFVYINAHTKGKVWCNKCKEFFDCDPHHHISKSFKCGCPKCGIEKNSEARRMPLNEFIERSTKTHGGWIKYDLVTKINSVRDIVNLICPEHGIFKQEVNSHLCGSGCPSCKNSRGQNKVAEYLKKIGISFVQEYKFEDCKYINRLIFDFFFELHGKKICIEYQGRQHYESISFFGGDEALKLNQKKDNIKREYCKNNNIKLIEVPYWIDDIEKYCEDRLLNG